MSAEASKVAAVSSIRPYSNIPEMLRLLAKQIEEGDVPAEEVLCIVRAGVSDVGLWGWDENRGLIANLGMLESAKQRIETGDVNARA